MQVNKESFVCFIGVKSDIKKKRKEEREREGILSLAKKK
jgi:hypothetical protein